MNTILNTRTTSGDALIIKIRCNDDNNNGHNTFAITGTVYEKGKPHIEKHCVKSGRIHEDILKAKKSLKPFIDLHLSDGEGIPLYAIENGFYYYQIYKGVAAHHKKDNGDFKYFDILSEHLRIDSDECQKLVDTLDNAAHLGEQSQKIIFAEYVAQQKPRWKIEADKAKELLQQLIDSNKTLA